MDDKMSLLIEVHESIDEYSKIGDILRNPESLSEWDRQKTSEEDFNAITACDFSEPVIQAIENIISDRMFTVFFHFFSVMDGVGDPKLRNTEDVWLGFRLDSKSNDHEGEYDEFLHDMLFEAYEKWQEIKERDE